MVVGAGNDGEFAIGYVEADIGEVVVLVGERIIAPAKGVFSHFSTFHLMSDVANLGITAVQIVQRVVATYLCVGG